MQVAIKNFMGIEKASLDVSKIALVCGTNHQGKTSLCRAVSAALSGETLPLNLKKGDAGMLVRSGSAKGEVEVTTADGSALVTWPKAERHTEGTPPYASRYATGAVFYTDLTAKQAVDTLTDLMDAAPTQDDLREALSEFKPKVIGAVWESIDRDGWDLAHTRATDKGKEYKTQWRMITKSNYGTKVAESWVPDKWDDNLAEKSAEALETHITACRAELEDGIAKQAVAGDEIERLQEAASKRNGAERGNTEKLAIILNIEEELESITTERAELPAVNDKDPMHCPHCNEPVVIDPIFKTGTTLKKAEKIDKKEQDKRGLDIASFDGRIENAKDRLNRVKTDLAQHVKDLI
ncbi:MAG: hypothetical protein V7727_22145, partial [Sneathiella sp.]